MKREFVFRSARTVADTFRYLSDLGVGAQRTDWEKRSVRLCNQTALLLAAATVCSMLTVEICDCDLTALSRPLVTALTFYCSVPFMMRAGHAFVAKCLLVAVSNLFFVAYCLLLGPSSGADLAFFVSLAFPLVIFEPRRTKAVFASLATPVVLRLLLLFVQGVGDQEASMQHFIPESCMATAHAAAVLLSFLTCAALAVLAALENNATERYWSRLVAKLEQEIVDRSRIQSEMNAARAAAENDRNVKASFLAMMSHEIRTPLSGVIGLTGLLFDTPLDPDQREMLNMVRVSGETLLSIINDILDFSKIEAGKLSLEEVEFNPEDCIEEAIAPLAPLAEARDLELISEVDADIPHEVVGDPLRIRQILNNLISNAIKFTGSKGLVRIRVFPVTMEHCDPSARPLRFEVQDTGIGLSRETAARLFRPFTQGGLKTSRKYGGTGLGLAICKQLCNLMGAEIGIDSELGRGTTFWFVVPFKVPLRRRSASNPVLSSAPLSAPPSPPHPHPLYASLHTNLVSSSPGDSHLLLHMSPSVDEMLLCSLPGGLLEDVNVLVLEQSLPQQAVLAKYLQRLGMTFTFHTSDAEARRDMPQLLDAGTDDGGSSSSSTAAVSAGGAGAGRFSLVVLDAKTLLMTSPAASTLQVTPSADASGRPTVDLEALLRVTGWAACGLPMVVLKTSMFQQGWRRSSGSVGLESPRPEPSTRQQITFVTKPVRRRRFNNALLLALDAPRGLFNHSKSAEDANKPPALSDSSNNGVNTVDVSVSRHEFTADRPADKPPPIVVRTTSLQAAKRHSLPSILLPAASAAAQQPAPLPLVLVVEDNAVNQKVVVRMLEKLGCRVHTASDGRQAVRSYETGSYDLVFMDVHLPDIDGFETSRLIRRIQDRTVRVPIVALTASALESDRAQALSSGLDDFLSKPVELKALSAMLAKWLPRPRSRSPSPAPVDTKTKKDL